VLTIVELDSLITSFPPKTTFVSLAQIDAINVLIKILVKFVQITHISRLSVVLLIVVMDGHKLKENARNVVTIV